MSEACHSRKYPRSYHLQWSPGGTSDDKRMTTVEGLLREPLVISEKLDGCVHKDTRISTATGERRRIIDIHSGDFVLGYTPDCGLVPSKVLAVHRNGRAGRWLQIRGTHTEAGRGSSFFSLYCTPNHRFWNPITNVYVAAETLRLGDPVLLVRSELKLTPIQKSVALGKLLGDGSLACRKGTQDGENFTAAIKWSQKIDAYTDWTAKAFGDLASPSVSSCVSGFGTRMSRRYTFFNPGVYRAFKDFLGVDGKKCVPAWVEAELDPIALAFWYMDDGSLAAHEGQENRASFAVCGFTQEDCHTLQRGLAHLGIQSVFYTSKGYCYLRLNSEDSERLFLLIAPYIPPSMQYKLPVRYRGHAGWLPDAGKKHFREVLIPQKITSIEEAHPPACSQRYDLTTETGNFFANGVLTHNSNIVLLPNCIYARSHGGPPTHVSYNTLKAIHSQIRHLIPLNFSVFCEYTYAVHSIVYDALPSYVWVIGVRDDETGHWMAWDDVVMVAAELGLPTVPVLWRGVVDTVEDLQDLTTLLGQAPGLFGPREGVVARVARGFDESEFSFVLGKFVRAGHVTKNAVHWMKRPVQKQRLVGDGS